VACRHWFEICASAARHLARSNVLSASIGYDGVFVPDIPENFF
jgi:hypothetical protein